MMLYLVPLVCLCLGAATANTNQVKVDGYVDALLRDVSKQLEEARMEPLNFTAFNFKIPSTGISNRDVKANITLGRFEGLSRLRRDKACNFTLPTLPRVRTSITTPGNLTINCNVTIAGVKAVLANGTFKGDTITGSQKAFNTTTTIDQGLINIRLVGRPGLKGNLTSIALDRVVLTTSYPKVKPDLNTARMHEFTDELNRHMGRQLMAFASGTYKRFWQTAVSRKVLPYLAN